MKQPIPKMTDYKFDEVVAVILSVRPKVDLKSKKPKSSKKSRQEN